MTKKSNHIQQRLSAWKPREQLIEEYGKLIESCKKTVKNNDLEQYTHLDEDLLIANLVARESRNNQHVFNIAVKVGREEEREKRTGIQKRGE